MKDLVDMGAQFVILGSGSEKIEKIFIKAEKKYPKSRLKKLARTGQYDKFPPHTFNRYEYKDENGYTFDSGGLKFIY